MSIKTLVFPRLVTSDLMASEDNHNSEADWFWSSVVSAVSGSSGLTLVAGMFCGVLANIILRGRPSPSSMSSASNSVMGLASAVTRGPCKMVLVVRTDVGMGKGKVAAQCAHAAVMCYKKALRDAPDLVERWEGLGVTKVCVKVDNEEALLGLAAKAREAGVVHAVVRDAGRTQIAAGTMTVLGIGPTPTDVAHQLTGHLKLY